MNLTLLGIGIYLLIGMFYANHVVKSMEKTFQNLDEKKQDRIERRRKRRFNQEESSDLSIGTKEVLQTIDKEFEKIEQETEDFYYDIDRGKSLLGEQRFALIQFLTSMLFWLPGEAHSAYLTIKGKYRVQKFKFQRKKFYNKNPETFLLAMGNDEANKRIESALLITNKKFKIFGKADDTLDAYQKVKQLRPDVLILSEELPLIDSKRITDLIVDLQLGYNQRIIELSPRIDTIKQRNRLVMIPSPFKTEDIQKAVSLFQKKS